LKNNRGLSQALLGGHLTHFVFIKGFFWGGVGEVTFSSFYILSVSSKLLLFVLIYAFHKRSFLRIMGNSCAFLPNMHKAPDPILALQRVGKINPMLGSFCPIVASKSLLVFKSYI
jgi:hypothetical protein